MTLNLRRGAFLLALISALLAFIPAGAIAASSGAIDYSTANKGTFTVTYNDATEAPFKVGVVFSGASGTAYYDYKPNTTATYKLDKGSGTYAVALFKKVKSAYVSVATASFTAMISSSAASATTAASVTIDGSSAVQEIPGGATTAEAPVAVTSKFPEYIKSIREVSFSTTDSVVKKAADLCKDKDSDQKKILAIYNYIAKNFKYDYDFANKVRSGQIRTYCPTPTSILSNKKGVCYDFSSLFAAMCRSQGIACKLVKGYSTKINGYHAWNSVYDAKTDEWYIVDLTLAVCKSNKTASKFSKCYMADKYYTAKSSV